MITTLISDFSNVLVFSKGIASTVSAYFHSFADDRSINDILEVNKELLIFLSGKELEHLNKYIFSASSIDMLETMRGEVIPPFINLYSSKELGTSKNDPQAYLHLLHKLELQPQEVLFIDDSLSKIEAAQQAGITSIQYFDNTQVIRAIQKQLHS